MAELKTNAELTEMVIFLKKEVEDLMSRIKILETKKVVNVMEIKQQFPPVQNDPQISTTKNPFLSCACMNPNMRCPIHASQRQEHWHHF